jgi:hypothetical protein
VSSATGATAGGYRRRERELATKLTTNRYGPLVAPGDLISLLVRNPDELFEADINGYDKVMGNPIVSSELISLISPITDAEKSVVGYGDEADKVLTNVLNNIPDLQDCIEQLLYAYITGIRLVEIIWGNRMIDGVYYNVPVGFESHDVLRFAFDERGRLWMTQDGSGGSYSNRNDVVIHELGYAEFVHPRKMLIHRYRSGDGRNGYGWGEGRALYRWVEFFNATLAFWADYNQSYGRPIKWLKVDHEALQAAIANANSISDTGADSQESYLDEMRAKLERLIEHDVWADDARNELVLLSPEKVPQDIFAKLVEFATQFIKLHISGETLTSGEGSQGNGSYALSKTHMQVQIGRRGRLTRGIQNTLSNQLLPHILHYNRAALPMIPKNALGRVSILSPKMAPEEQIELGTKANLEVRKSEIHEMLGFGVPTDEEVAMGDTVKLGSSNGGEGMPGGSPFPPEFNGMFKR